MAAEATTVRQMAATDFTFSPLRLDRPTLNEVGVLAARGFHDDPFYVYLAPQPLLRARGLAIFMRGHVAVLGDAGIATGAHDRAGNLVGISVWQRPGTYPLPLRAQVRDLACSFRAMLPRPPALVAGLRYVRALEKEHPRDEHWYLALLVADPMVWRRGIGTGLLEPFLDSIDPEGLPCYLETQKVANLAYYRRFGFELTNTVRPTRTGPPLFTMTRPPR